MGALLCLIAWHWPSSDIRIWHQELLFHSHLLGPRLIFDTVDIIVCGTLASMCCFMYAIGRIVLSRLHVRHRAYYIYVYREHQTLYKRI